MTQTVVYLVIVAVGLFVIWRDHQRRKWRVRIEFVPNEPPVLHGLAAAAASLVVSFLQKDLHLDRPITILATKERSGRLRTRIKGDVDDGTRQQIRNFLMELL